MAAEKKRESNIPPKLNEVTKALVSDNHECPKRPLPLSAGSTESMINETRKDPEYGKASLEDKRFETNAIPASEDCRGLDVIPKAREFAREEAPNHPES
jgi:hypothetical protein